jgi:glyoxylase-like metal-dependent hydrolase (beta-lactamase superfamily II)
MNGRSPVGSPRSADPVQQVAEGVYRLGTEWVGWYLYDTEGAVVVIDCGFPGYHDQLPSALEELNRPLGSVAAVVLTHYHPDHVGAAELIRAETGATVHVPAGDAAGVRSGNVPMPSGMASNLWRPRMMRYAAHAIRSGASKVGRVPEFRTYEDGDVIAGGLRAVHTPGHTTGHCALLAEGAGVLFAGDALATLSLLNGRTGPDLMPFNEDPGQARESLSRLEHLAAGVVVVGHGDPFEGTPSEAVQAITAKLPRSATRG